MFPKWTKLSAEEQRKTIVKVLNHYYLDPQHFLDTFAHQHIISLQDCQNYLAEHLIPVVQAQYTIDLSNYDEDSDTKRRVGELHELCFNGYLSETVWEKLWKDMPVKDQVFHTTTWNTENPVWSAVYHNQPHVLAKLFTLYQRIPVEFPDRLEEMQQRIKDAWYDTAEQFLELKSNAVEGLVKLSQFLTSDKESLAIVFQSICKQQIRSFINFSQSRMRCIQELCESVAIHDPTNFETFRNALIEACVTRLEHDHTIALADAKADDHTLRLVDVALPSEDRRRLQTLLEYMQNISIASLIQDRNRRHNEIMMEDRQRHEIMMKDMKDVVKDLEEYCLPRFAYRPGSETGLYGGFFRFFSGRWNRHHIEPVSIVLRKCHAGEIDSPLSLHEALTEALADRPINPKGDIAGIMGKLERAISNNRPSVVNNP